MLLSLHHRVLVAFWLAVGVCVQHGFVHCLEGGLTVSLLLALRKRFCNGDANGLPDAIILQLRHLLGDRVRLHLPLRVAIFL